MSKRVIMVLNNIYWRLVGPIICVGIILLVAVGLVVPRFIKDNVENTAMSNANEVIRTFRSIRDFYNKTVVAKVLEADSLIVSHMHGELDNAIPAPASFLIGMAGGDEDSDNVTIALTSPFPFAHRQGRINDKFQKEAWAKLRPGSDDYFAMLDHKDGRDIFRIAVPDKMNHKSCVNCHNSHPASLKRGWSLGDTRGIIEVRFDVTEQLTNGETVSLVVVLIFGIAIVGLVFFAHMSARTISRPLGAVTSALHNLAEDRAIDDKDGLNETQVDEIRKLSLAFDKFQDHEDQRKRLMNDITELAFFDPLTGLSNKTRFVNILNYGLEQIGVSDIVPLICLVGIDRYQDLHDTLGHRASDALVQTIARRFARLNPDEFHAARYSEDTFIVLSFYQPTRTGDYHERVVGKLRELFVKPVQVERQAFQLTGSYGVAFAPYHGKTADELMTAADVALGKALGHGGDDVAIYSQDMAEEIQHRLMVANDLKKALDEEVLLPYFQPQIDLETGQLIGAEALLRWPKPDGSFISPGVFIPIAEHTHLILDIGHYVIDKVCRYIAEWQAQGIAVPRIAINISAIQFVKEDVADLLVDAMTHYGVRPTQLEVEITESAMSECIDVVQQRFSAIRELGVEIALDDFGTGYSSLSYLQSLPLDRLKIDQSFVREMLKDDQSCQIVKTIISLGRTMELQVIAEGIETEEERAALYSMGCQEGQGYHFARPLPPEAFFDFVKAFHSDRHEEDLASDIKKVS